MIHQKELIWKQASTPTKHKKNQTKSVKFPSYSFVLTRNQKKTFDTSMEEDTLFKQKSLVASEISIDQLDNYDISKSSSS